MKYLELAQIFREKGIVLFSSKEFAQIGSFNQNAAWAALGRYCQKGLIENPKRGLYYFADNPPDSFFLANKLYAPSYISFETALSYYSIIPEAIYSITSASTKVTRNFKHRGKNFKYLTIKTNAYTGYYKKDDYLIADPEKALVDYLYFVALGKKKINERFSTSQLDRKKLLSYTQLFANNKLTKIAKTIC